MNYLKRKVSAVAAGICAISAALCLPALGQMGRPITDKELSTWCNSKNVESIQMMAMMGGNGVGSYAYYRYMDKVLDGIYVNNIGKAKTSEDKAWVREYVTKAKRYIYDNCPG